VTCAPASSYSGPDSATASVTGACRDAAGNTGSATASFKYDATTPSISIAAPTTTSYTLGQVVAASYTCSDGGSGAASCVGTVANGATIDTASAGAKTFTVSAADSAGNTSVASMSYAVSSVVYNFSGFLQPVDNLPTLNRVKAGSAVPIKFSLGGTSA